MSVYPCSACRTKRPGKLANLYWAWFLADGARSGWKQRLCAYCAPIKIGELLRTVRAGSMADSPFACLACGIDASGDSDPVYLTLYVPGRDPEELAFQLDSACAVKIRAQAQEGAERLPDRGGLVRGPSPTTTVWDALGLSPN